MNAKIQTEYLIEVTDIRTGKVRHKEIFHNLIVNDALDKPGYGKTRYTHIQVGSGTGTPKITDTRLFSVNLTKEAVLSNSNYDYENGKHTLVAVIDILETELNGITLTEVGICKQTAYGSGFYLATHAMLKTPILKTNTDSIKISINLSSCYENCFAFFGGTIKILGSFISRFTNLDYFNNTSYDCVGLNSLFNYLIDSTTASLAMTGGEYSYMIRFPSTTTNINNSIVGINKIINEYHILYPICSEWFSGTDIFDELLITDGIKKDFSLRWGLIENLELKREDGTVIPTSDYTVDLMKLKTIDKSLAYFLLPRESNTFTHDKSFLECKDSIAKELSLINIGEGVYQKFYNPAYRYGIDKLFIKGNARVEGYLESEGKWYVLGTFSNITEKEFIIPEKLRNCSIWKFTQLDIKGIRINPISEIHSEYAPIHFINPPANGEKIYANYKTKYIAKTANNTYDLTQTFTFGQGQGSNPQIDITELFVNPTSVDLTVGETVVLEVSYKPANAVNDITYTSDNPLVAVFEQGAIRAISVGTCTCKVKSKNVYQDILVTVKEII